MDIAAKTIKLKMSLEGIPNIPINAIQIQEGLNTTPSCTVSVAFNKFAAALLPGTLAHIYYYKDQKWILIFEGELATINITKSTGLKTINLFFVGLTNIWDHAWIQKINFSLADSMVTNQYINMSAYTNKGKDSSDDNTNKILPILPAKTLGSVALSNISALLMDFLDQYRDSGALTTTTLFEKFFSYIEGFNEYYGRMDRTQRLKDRTYVIENTKTKDLVSNVAFRQFVTNTSDSEDVMSVKQLLSLICSYIGYDWVELPVPVVIGGSLKSIILKPRLAFAAPIMCNVVYPEDIMELRYTHNFLRKPTRLSSRSNPLIINGSVSTLIGFAPKTSLTASSGILTRVHTTEERLRGIYPAQENAIHFLDQTFLDSYYRANQDESDEPESLGSQVNEESPVELTSKGEDYNKMLRNIVDRRYFELRSDATQTSIMTEYSPYRMLGFPGAFLEEDLPVLTGVIAGIASSISAEGMSTQNISLAFCTPYILTNNADLQQKLIADLEENPLMPEYYSSEIFDITKINTVYAEFGSKSIYELLPDPQKIDGKENKENMVKSLKNLLAFPKKDTTRHVYTQDIKAFIGTGLVSIKNSLDAKVMWPYITDRQDMVNIVIDGLGSAQNAL